MPMYDFKCTECGLQFERLVPHQTFPPCPGCCSPTEKVWTGVGVNVIPDDVPGGFVIENLDKVPRRFYSKSAYRDELRARGLTTERGDQHLPTMDGSDKNPHRGSRWY